MGRLVVAVVVGFGFVLGRCAGEVAAPPPAPAPVARSAMPPLPYETCWDVVVVEELLRLTQAELDGVQTRPSRNGALGHTPDGLGAVLETLRATCPAMTHGSECPGLVPLGAPENSEPARARSCSPRAMYTRESWTWIDMAESELDDAIRELEQLPDGHIELPAAQRELARAYQCLELAQLDPVVPVPPPPLADPVTRDADCAAWAVWHLRELDTLRRAAHGDPVPFPPDLDPAYQPARVEANARRVNRNCAELGWKLLEVECTEFPCFTVWDRSAVPPIAHATSVRLARQCGASIGLLDGPTSGSDFRSADGREVEVMVIAAAPPGSNVDFGDDRREAGRVKSRMPLRIEAVVQRLRRAYDATSRVGGTPRGSAGDGPW